MKLWRMPWAEIPLSVKIGMAVVLAAMTVTACALPLVAQTASPPVQVENLVVGWMGLVALLGMAAQWGALIMERSYNRAQMAEFKETLTQKLDTERVAGILRELDQTRSEIRSLNLRLDRTLVHRGE